MIQKPINIGSWYPILGREKRQSVGKLYTDWTVHTGLGRQLDTTRPVTGYHMGKVAHAIHVVTILADGCFCQSE